MTVKSIASILSGAEKKLSAAEAERRAERDALLATIPNLEADKAAAERLPKDIESAWLKGDASYSSGDLLSAKTEVERCALILTGVKSKAQRLSGKLSARDADVANALVPYIAAAVMGADVIATNAPSKYWGEIPRNTEVRPAVVLVQETDTVANMKTGSIAAKVTVYYFRTRSNSELTQRELERALSKAEGHVTVSSATSFSAGEDGYFTDKANVVVSSIWSSGIPLMAALDAADVEAEGKRLAFSLGQIPIEAGYKAGNSNFYGTHGGHTSKGWERSGYSMKAHGPYPTACLKVDGGIQTVTVKGTVNVVSYGSTGSTNAHRIGVGNVHDLCADGLRDEAERLTGGIAPGLGRCESFAIVRGANERPTDGVPFHFTGVYVSRVA